MQEGYTDTSEGSDRICRRCSSAKPLDAFLSYKRKGEKRYQHICKECGAESRRASQRKWIEANREKHNAKSRNWKKAKYQSCEAFREKAKDESKVRYSDPELKEKKKAQAKKNYAVKRRRNPLRDYVPPILLL